MSALIHLNSCTALKEKAPEMVVYCEACGSYSKIFLKDGTSCLMTCPLKDLDIVLEEKGFIRIHRSYLVNLSEIIGYDRDRKEIYLNNDLKLPIARRRIVDVDRLLGVHFKNQQSVEMA